MDKIVRQLDENYQIKFERGIMDGVPYISTKHIDPLGNEVWGRICLKKRDLEKFTKLDETMEGQYNDTNIGEN